LALDSIGAVGGLSSPPPAPASAPDRPLREQTYPVDVEFNESSPRHRLWALPVLGFVAKGIILIPHFICLLLLDLLAGVYTPQPTFQLIGALSFGDVEAFSAWLVLLLIFSGAQSILWIPVLFGGKYPLWGYVLVGGLLRWTCRVSAFLLGLTDQYPPFSLKSGRDDRPFDVQVRIHVAERSSRLWAVPILGWYVKVLALLPHWIILPLLWIAAGVSQLVLWLPVLVSRRYPAWGYRLVGGTLRWQTRVIAFQFGLTDRYPPFSLA